MIHEFRELIPVITPLGEALALLIECNNHDNWWTVILRDTGAVITYPQQDVLIHRNYSLGIAAPEHKDVKDAIERYARAVSRFHTDAAAAKAATVIQRDRGQGVSDGKPA